MCASLPVQIVALNPETALVDAEDRQVEVSRQLMPEAQPGDWVLVHAGQIVARIAPEEAIAIRELLGALLRPPPRP